MFSRVFFYPVPDPVAGPRTGKAAYFFTPVKQNNRRKPPQTIPARKPHVVVHLYLGQFHRTLILPNYPL